MQIFYIFALGNIAKYLINAVIMKFTNCNFESCREHSFECRKCDHFDINGVSHCVDMIHPVLGCPMSKVPTK